MDRSSLPGGRVPGRESARDAQDLSALTDEVFTVSEVAVILKLSEQTIRNWIDAGTLPAVRLGRRIRIKRAVLQQILEHGL
jgi:excisionase family DNA binding protein